jgi:acyl carrier protein
MVPATAVVLEEMPLTPNGKIDRRALPEPDQTRPDLESLYVAPRTPTETLIADIWSQVLGAENVGIHDNFFDLGGHSLLAIQVMSRVRQALQVEVPLRRLFDAQTVEGLAAYIEQARQEEQGLQTPPIGPVARGGELPLSFAQQRLWFLDHLESGSPFYNVSTAVHLAGRLNLATLEQTFGEIVRRHEVLRTTFPSIDGRPVQVIGPPERFAIPVLDLSDLPSAARAAEGRRLAGECARRPFDLAQDRLLRVMLLCSGDQDQTVLFTMHHIITDGWSTGLIVREVTTLYSAFFDGNASELPELPIQYADFAGWQRQWLRGEALDAQLDYWKRYLSGTLPVLELPADRPRPAMQSHRGATLPFGLPAQLTDSLKALSRREGVTLFMTLLAAFKALLYRYTSQEDIIVGTDVANRMRGETEGMIGFFVNQLVMRADMSGDPTFRELLTQVREMTLGAYAHQDLPFELLVRELQPERDLSRTPLFQAKLIFLNVPMQDAKLPGLELSPMASETETAPFDFVLSITQTAGSLAGAAIYSTDLFDEETIARMIARFQTLLESVAADPEQRLASLRLLSEDEVDGLSVLDFPDADLSQKDFESLFMQFGRQQSLD